MAIGMARSKVTIMLDDVQVEAIRKLVASGAASSVSGFVQRAVTVGLEDVADWNALLGQALKHTGGPLTKKERAWADPILTRPAPKRRRMPA